MERRPDIDLVFLGAALALAVIGVSALAGATGPQASFAVKQVLWIALGIAALLPFLLIDYRTWSEAAPMLYGVGVLGLLAVLVLGHKVNGSKSWIAIAGLNIGQPSEIAKLTTVLLAARVLGDHHRDRATLGLVIRLGLVLGLPLLLILLQPDMGTGLTFVALLGASLFTVGLSKKVWALLLVAGLVGAGFGWGAVLKEYQRDRIRTFLTPEVDPQATGYQIIQSRIAIGSGGLLGKGWAAGTQSQLNFIPEKHTDFIFPVVAEERGFVGAALVLLLYAVLVTRGLRIAAQARDGFGAYAVLGIMAIIATHVVVNLGMVIGLLPTIGIPLPLMSYGGSSMVSTLAGVGLILNVQMRRSASGR